MSEKDYESATEGLQTKSLDIELTDPASNNNDDENEPEDSANVTTNSKPNNSIQSSPIEIRQAASGKFGVFHARQPSPSPSQQLTDSNGEPVPIDKLIKTANTMSSMMMAHKIALEDDFRLEPGMDMAGPLMSLSPIIGSSPSGANTGTMGPSQEPNLHSRVKDIVHEAYWDLFREEVRSQTFEVESDKRYDQSKQLLFDIKQKIFELLLPQHARLKQDIDDKLDAKIIDQLAGCYSLNLIEYGHYILGVMAKLCAPVRDEKLKELSEQSDVVQLYRGIMELLELMRLDLANFTLNRFKPHIKAHSQDYEREKFNEILRQQKNIGIDGLEYTRIWLDRAVHRVDSIHGLAELVTVDAEEPIVGIINDNSTSGAQSTTIPTSTLSVPLTKADKIMRSETITKVINSAYCELLEWNPQVQKLYPETLLFDEGTFRSLSEQYKVLLMTSSILLATFAFLRNFKLHESQEFKISIKAHIITLLTASYERQHQPTTSSPSPDSQQPGSSSTAIATGSKPNSLEALDRLKLETVAAKLSEDIKKKLQDTNPTLVDSFEKQRSLLTSQILDLQSSTNRVKELARRRILEFVETLLDLDIKHQQKKFPSRMPPPVNIPLGLNCLTDEITLTMAQLVKIVRYNRKVFFQHYQDIIVELVSKII